MKAGARTILSVGAVFALVCCAQRTGNAPAPAADLHRAIPDLSSLSGWRIVEGPVEFAADTLFEYLDGGADRYLAHGFRRLVQVRYGAASDASGGVTLDLYDMGSKLGAFGIYSAARPKAADFREWGAEGYRSGYVAAAWKGPIYVHAEATDDRPESTRLLDRVMASACAAVPGDTAPPAILLLLPPEGLEPRSERYVARDLLGHACLPGGVLAGYTIEGREAEMFFSELASEAAAAGTLATLRAHYSRSGELLGDAPAAGAGGFRFAARGLGEGTVARAGRFVIGVHGDVAAEPRERLLARLAKNLRQRRDANR